MGLSPLLTAGQSVMNHSVSYAISALVQLAAHRGSSPLPNTAICESTGMPPRFVLQILNTLGKAGIITGYRGVHGGYRLAKPADQITLHEIFAAVSDWRIVPRDDLLAGFDASGQRAIYAAYAGIEADQRRRLAGITVADLKAKA